MSLAKPRLTCPSFSLTQPLTRRALIDIRAALRTAANIDDLYGSHQNIRRLDVETAVFQGSVVPNAAVLIPLCNMKEQPVLLFEVRGNLRAHAGEVRYVLGLRIGRLVKKIAR